MLKTGRWFFLLMLASASALADTPRVVDGAISGPDTNGTHRIAVTVRHADLAWDHYANNFEILTPAGELIRERVLAHPHVEEQPFTRSAYGIQLPQGISEIQVRARDSVHGYGPAVSVPIPGR